MRRLPLLIFFTVVCWGLAMACSRDDALPQAPAPAVTDGTSGQVNPPVPGGGGEEDIAIPFPTVMVTIDGKPVVQDGSYPATELKAHASDAKSQATAFHWALVGPEISGGQFADGADFLFKLPVVAEKAAYELTLVGNLGGKAVQQSLHFFTVPAPTAKIMVNVNQAGLPVNLNPGGGVLKGQKIQISADAKYADAFKWLRVVNNGAATELGKNPTAEFVASDVGSYKILLMAFGPGGHTDTLEFKFDVKDNAVAIKVKGTVTKDAFSAELSEGGQYPVGATLTMDASGILPADGLASMSCVLKDPKGIEKTFASNKVDLLSAGKNTVTCAYKLKADYAEAAGSVLNSVVGFDVWPKAKAVMSLDGEACDPATPKPFLVGTSVKLSAAGSVGNISKYMWQVSSGSLENSGNVDAVLHIGKAVDLSYKVTLQAEGVGDSDSTSCTVLAKAIPNAVIAPDSTVQSGRSYIYGSFQRAQATAKTEVTGFDWSILSDTGVVLKASTTQSAADLFEFVLSEVGTLTLKLTSKLISFVGPTNSVSIVSKLGQVSLVTPVDFSKIQSIAAVSGSDVYFASPSAIFHKGVDGRVVQVKNIATHLAAPDGFFARNAGDVYLLTTDGGYWRYTFKDGWVYSSKGAGPNQQAITGPATGTRLFAAANSRLFAGDATQGTWTKIGDGLRYVTVQGSYAYAAAPMSGIDGASTEPAVVQCTPVACTPLKWNVDPGNVLTWKSIGASASAVFLSDANGRVYTVQGGLVSMVGSLKNDDWIVSYSPRSSIAYAIGNKGGVYRIFTTGVAFLYESPATITHAAGVMPEFWAWDEVAQQVNSVKDAAPVPVVAQPALGIPPAPCMDQKQMWMLGNTAVVSVCSVPAAGKPPLYTIWSAPYQGAFVSHANLSAPTPVVGVASDGAGGWLIMRSDGANENYIQQLAAGGNAPAALNVNLNNGEFFVDMSGQFFITNQGVRLNDAQNYPLVQPVAGVQHPVADGDVLYFTYKNNARLARFDLKQVKVDDLAGVDPADPNDPGPLVDVIVDSLKRVYVLTAKSLYLYEGGMVLKKIYDAPGALMTRMASMNGHHMLVSLASKGLALVDLSNATAGAINPDTEVGAATESWSVGYNGTEFLFLGRNMNTNALFLHQYGAPQ